MKARDEEFVGLRERLWIALYEAGYWDEKRQAPSAAKFCARFSGYDAKFLASWLNPRERRRPNLAELKRIAMDLGISYTHLLLGRRVFDSPEWERLETARQRHIGGSYVPPKLDVRPVGRSTSFRVRQARPQLGRSSDMSSGGGSSAQATSSGESSR